MKRCEHRMRHTGNRCQFEEWHEGRHAHDPADEARITQNEIFGLILCDGESSRLRAAELIRELNPKERRDLRAACQDLDNLIDDVWLEELRETRRRK